MIELPGQGRSEIGREPAFALESRVLAPLLTERRRAARSSHQWATLTMAHRSRKKADVSAQPCSKVNLDVDTLVVRARTSARRGDARKAVLLLERACCLASEDARAWTLYAVQCQRMGKLDDATRAFRQAIWLRERARDERRAEVLRRLLSDVRRELPAA